VQFGIRELSGRISLVVGHYLDCHVRASIRRDRQTLEDASMAVPGSPPAGEAAIL
jgi:hypothetical protein